MEVPVANRPTPNNDVDFPLQLIPFPEAADVLYDDRAAEIRPPEMDHLQLPPQKLRPIRCNGRTLPEYSDPPVPKGAGLEGTLLGCHGELGFLTQLSPEYTTTLPDLGCGSLLGNAGSGVAGNACSVVDFSMIEQMKTQMNSECVNLISEGRLFETELSSSSDDDGDSLEAVTDPLSRKRKRKTRKKLELFLENTMRKVVQKQEQMHKQLMEMIEKKERERMVREAAWQQQEIERAKKDEEVRAQERSRSLALISFIQNFLGHGVQIPKSWETSSLEKDEGEMQKDLTPDSSNKRWPKSEVQALITIRTALDHKFLKGPKSAVWQEVALGLSNMGYCWSAKKCKEKWENITKYYKRTTENGKKHADNGKMCPYFHELDILYKNGLISPGNASHPVKNEIEDKSAE